MFFFLKWVVIRTDIFSLKRVLICNINLVTDIKPGFVDTDMAKGEGKFWVATPQKAAEQIYSAINKQKLHT